MSTTQVIGKEKRGSSSFVRPQLRNVTKPTNTSKLGISTANSRTPKPTTTASKSSSTVSPKPSSTASTIKSAKKTLSSSTTRNVEKPPTLNRRGSLNNAPSSVRIQRSLSTARKTTVGEKLVQSKSAPSLKTVDKSVPKLQKNDLRSSRSLSAHRKPKDGNVMKPSGLDTEPERISSDNQDVLALSEETKEFSVNVIEDDHYNQNHTPNTDEIDNDCSDKTRDKIEHELQETEIHIELDEDQINIAKHSHPHEDDQSALKEGENKPETAIDQLSNQQEEGERFLKASEIRRRMEAQAGSKEAATPWQVVRGGGGSRTFNRKEVASPVSNEVIEETTSKLIKENKKNKVLAMVGAFETVMSNQ